MAQIVALQRMRACVEALESRRLFAGVAHGTVASDAEGQTPSTVGVLILTPDRFEANDTLASATVLGAAGQLVENDLSIHQSGDHDFFRFTAAADGAVQAQITFSHALGDIDMYLYNESQLLIASSVGTDNSEIVSNVAAAGATFYIEVVGYSGVTNPDYDLIVDGAASPGDHLESNDEFVTATGLGTLGDRIETGLSIHHVGDDDWFTFVAGDNGSIEVYLSFLHALGDLDMWFYNGALEPLAFSDGVGDNEHFSANVIAGHTYYVHVYGYNGATHPDYDLAIDGPGGLPAWMDPASSAIWDVASQTLMMTGAATIIADPANTGDHPIINATGAAAVLTVDPASDLHVHAAALHLTGGATAAITSLGGLRTANNHRVLVVGTLDIGPGSTLDITDNDLIVDYTGASGAADYEALVRSAYNGAGSWDGPGITSSIAAIDGGYTVAVADNATLAAPFGSAGGGPLFAGVDVDLDTVLIKFTHRVDINLDGLVTPDDAAIFGTNYSENDFATWAMGDIDYDGVFTPSDAAIFGTFYDESLFPV